MQIPKAEIMKLIESKQGKELAAKAEQELPALIHHVDHAGLLSKFGIKPEELASRGAKGSEGALASHGPGNGGQTGA